jgi:hypothetical protein
MEGIPATCRTWLDSTGAPVAMQRELMGQASIETTTNGSRLQWSTNGG